MHHCAFRLSPFPRLLPVFAAAMAAGLAFAQVPSSGAGQGAAGAAVPATATRSQVRSTVPLAGGLTYADPLTIRAPFDFLRAHAPTTETGLLHAVVEIPTGACEKWEVKLDGVMRWDLQDGAPRQVRYLGYPANYGIVPRALLGKELGGDGDPLDVLVLGPALPRGTVAAVKLLGVLHLTEKGDRDDKLVAVPTDSPLAAAGSMAELEQRFPGIQSILRTWFENYKGRGALLCQGFGEADEARNLLADCAASFARAETGVPDGTAPAAPVVPVTPGGGGSGR